MEREYDAVPKGDSLMRLAEDLFLFFKSVARGAFPRGLAKPLIGLSIDWNYLKCVRRRRRRRRPYLLSSHVSTSQNQRMHMSL